MARVIALGGRLFAPAEQTTSRQDGWVMVQLEDAGILALITKGAKALTDENAVRGVVVQALRSGKYHAILAGLLVEDKEKWTPQSAETNAEFFAELTSEEDKTQLRDTFTGLLIAFFQTGGPSSTPSPIVSAEPVAPRPTSRPRAKRSTAPAGARGPTVRDGSPMAIASA